MNIVVTGGAGFLGSKVISALLAAKDRGTAATLPFDTIISVDLAPSQNADPRVVSLVGNIADPDILNEAIGSRTAGIYHLAAVVSGQAEADFDLGMSVNLDGMRALLEACRRLPQARPFVFASSLAVFGGKLPAIVPDDQALLPQSSYGMQKAVGEFLVADYTRKGFIDGRACRLPTIVIRPGKPNAAASSFASGIIREPLAGIPTTCPVPLSTRMWISSPAIVVENLVHAIQLPSEKIGMERTINVPGISATIGEMLDSLERIGGAEVRSLVELAEDQRIIDIVCSWPSAFDVRRAVSLGFSRDEDFDAIVRQYQKSCNA